MEGKNKLAMWIFKALAALLGLAVMAFSIWNTWSLLSIVMPGDDLRALLGVGLFDIGMLVWFGVFVYASEGTAQRAIALMAGVLTMVGTLAANWFYLTLGGQTLFRVDPSSGEWAIRTVELAIILHIVAMIGHFVGAPHIKLAIKVQEMHDDAVEDAMRVAEQNMSRTRADAARAIGDTIHADVMRSLQAQADKRVGVIEGTAREVPSAGYAYQEPRKLGVMGTLRRWWAGDDVPPVGIHLQSAGFAQEAQSMPRTRPQGLEFIDIPLEIDGNKYQRRDDEWVDVWYSDGSTGCIRHAEFKAIHHAKAERMRAEAEEPGAGKP